VASRPIRSTFNQGREYDDCGSAGRVSVRVRRPSRFWRESQAQLGALFRVQIAGLLTSKGVSESGRSLVDKLLFGGVIHGSNPCAVAIRRTMLAHDKRKKRRRALLTLSDRGRLYGQAARPA
jgi:hypothetical protein